MKIITLLVTMWAFAVSAETLSNTKALALIEGVSIPDWQIFPMDLGPDFLVFKNQDGHFWKVRLNANNRDALRAKTQLTQIDIKGEPSIYAYLGCGVPGNCGWDPTTDEGNKDVTLKLVAMPATEKEYVQGRIVGLCSHPPETAKFILNRIKELARKSSIELVMAKQSMNEMIDHLQKRMDVMVQLQQWDGGNYVDEDNFNRTWIDLKISKKLTEGLNGK